MDSNLRMRFGLSIPAALIAAALAAAPAGGQFIDPPGLGNERNLSADRLVRMRLTADTASIAPGRSFRLAVVLDLQEHWHVYWRFAGEAGLPTELEVTAPDGFTVGETLYPRPKAFREPEGTTYGYENKVVLFVPVTAPETLSDGEADFRVSASFLVCRGRCLLGDAEQSISLPTSGAATGNPAPPEAPDRELLETYDKRLPRPLKELDGAGAVLQEDRLVVSGPCPGHDAVEFFPIEAPGVRLGTVQATVADGRFRIVVEYETRPQNARGRPMSVCGVIGLGRKSDGPCYHLSLPLDVAERP